MYNKLWPVVVLQFQPPRYPMHYQLHYSMRILKATVFFPTSLREPLTCCKKPIKILSWQSLGWAAHLSRNICFDSQKQAAMSNLSRPEFFSHILQTATSHLHFLSFITTYTFYCEITQCLFSAFFECEITNSQLWGEKKTHMTTEWKSWQKSKIYTTNKWLKD